MPADIVSLAAEPHVAPWFSVKHKSTLSRVVWVPSSLYWRSRTRINVPYLPYFSNCRGYGTTIPLWSLMEQHYNCELVNNEETFAMGAYKFGKAPIAD